MLVQDCRELTQATRESIVECSSNTVSPVRFLIETHTARIRTPVGVTTSGTLSGANWVFTDRCETGRAGCWLDVAGPPCKQDGMHRLV